MRSLRTAWKQGRLVGVARIESALRYSRGLRHGVHRRAVETELHEYFAGDARNMLIPLHPSWGARRNLSLDCRPL